MPRGGGRDLIQRYVLERVAQYATLLWHVILNNLKQNSDHKRKQNGHPRGMCVI